MKDLNGAKVLDYGCGRGDLSLYLLAQGGMVHGIDISPVYIRDVIKRCASEGYEQSRFQFYVMDCHRIDFPDDFFEMVVGLGILHHLDWSIALNEIHRVLRPGGRVLLQEPLADNPLVKFFRRLTPQARKEDERTFTNKDIEGLKHCRDWKKYGCR